jgi:hypothetical protein
MRALPLTMELAILGGTGAGRASAFCAGVNFGGRPMYRSRFRARLWPSALRVRI